MLWGEERKEWAISKQPDKHRPRIVILFDENRKLVGKEEKRLKLSFTHITLDNSVHPKGRVISMEARELEGNTDQRGKVDFESLHTAVINAGMGDSESQWYTVEREASKDDTQEIAKFRCGIKDAEQEC